jgi:hypothetical protein
VLRRGSTACAARSRQTISAAAANRTGTSIKTVRSPSSEEALTLSFRFGNVYFLHVLHAFLLPASK